MTGKGLIKIPFIEFHKRLATDHLQRHLRLLNKTAENAATSNNESLLGALQRIDWNQYRVRVQNGLSKAVAECVCGFHGMWQSFIYETRLADTKRALLQFAETAQQHLTEIRITAMKQQLKFDALPPAPNATLAPHENVNEILDRAAAEDAIVPTQHAAAVVNAIKEDPSKAAETTKSTSRFVGFNKRSVAAAEQLPSLQRSPGVASQVTNSIKNSEQEQIMALTRRVTPMEVAPAASPSTIPKSIIPTGIVGSSSSAAVAIPDKKAISTMLNLPKADQMPL